MGFKNISALSALVLWAGHAIAAPEPQIAENNFGIIEYVTVTTTTTVYGDICPEPTVCPACPSSTAPPTSSILVTISTTVASSSSAAQSSGVSSSMIPNLLGSAAQSTIASNTSFQSSAASSSRAVYYIPPPIPSSATISTSSAGGATSGSSSVPAQASSEPPNATSCMAQTTSDFSNQAAAIPKCAASCFADFVPQVGCSLTGYACQCAASTKNKLQALLTLCVISQCSPNQLQTLLLAAAQVCSCTNSAPIIVPGACSSAVSSGPASSFTVGGAASSSSIPISSLSAAIYTSSSAPTSMSEFGNVPISTQPSQTQSCATVTMTPDCSSQAAAAPQIRCALNDFACQCSPENKQALTNDALGCLLQNCSPVLGALQSAGNALCSCALGTPIVTTACSVSVPNSTPAEWASSSSSSYVPLPASNTQASTSGGAQTLSSSTVLTSEPGSTSSSGAAPTSNLIYVPPPSTTQASTSGSASGLSSLLTSVLGTTSAGGVPTLNSICVPPPSTTTVSSSAAQTISTLVYLPPPPPPVYNYGPRPAETKTAPIYLPPQPPLGYPGYHGKNPTLTRNRRPKKSQESQGYGGYGFRNYDYAP